METAGMSTFAFDPPRGPLQPTVQVCAGRVLMLAGAAFGSANIVQWGVLSGALGWHPAVLAVSWPAAVVAFLVGLRRLRRVGGAAGTRVASWSRAAILIQIAAALALLAGSAATGDWFLMRWTGAVGVTLYGVAWAVAALRSGSLAMGLLATGAFAGIAALAARIGSPDQYLISACALAFVALLPGLWLAGGRRL